MQRKIPSNLYLAIAVAAVLAVALASSAQAFRICTFKGTVIDHGWRTMKVKSRGQCATVNVGWRTKFIPNRRPCIGERVAVDFILTDGYMKATKIVSLTPRPAPVSCYPPPPPPGTVCRSVPEDTPETCVAPDPICSRTPPPHVRGTVGRERRPAARKPPRQTAAVKKPASKPPGPAAEKAAPDRKEPEPAPIVPEFKSLSGEVVASSPKSLSIRVLEDGAGAELVNIKVGLKTKFIPFRRPAVGEKVAVNYKMENGSKFGYTVKVVE